MRFSKNLQKIAQDLRKKFLNSTDEQDNTVLPEKWEDEFVNILNLEAQSKLNF